MGMKKKIVFVINYFYPDFASTGQLMTELCLELQHEFDIVVIAALPESGKKDARAMLQSDKLEGIKIVRIKLPELNKRSKWSRVKYICSYFIMALVVLMKEKNTDIIFTISTPPIIGGFIGTLGKLFKGSKHIYNIQDFNPEQAEAVSYVKGRWLFSLARFWDNVNCKYADHIIMVGQDMQETLIGRLKGARIPDHSVINNWTDENDIVPLTKDHPEVQQFIQSHDLAGKFIVMYSGNLGLYYDLENLIKVPQLFEKEEGILFLFIGDGAVSDEMKNYIQENHVTNVRFLPLQPKERIKFTLNAADVHLVVNQKGIKGVSVPSKIYGVMAAGKPILGVLEKGSEAEYLITTSNSGLIVMPKQYEELVDKIKLLHASSQEGLQEMGSNGRRYLETHLRKQMSIQKYQNILNRI
jgi:colanic acid biosynthesis glycosyl transferase WcaI